MTIGAAGISRRLLPSVRILGSHPLHKLINVCYAEKLFLKRFQEAFLMRSKHQELFTKFSATFKPETVEKWEKLVREWEQDDTKANPYAEPVNSTYFGFHQLRTSSDSRF
jgi:hypothetical protein